MTVRCGGGASNLIAGTGQQVVFSAALITEGIGLISPWLLPLAGLVDAFVYEALTQCTADPPAMPTTAELNPLNAVGGVLNPNFSAWSSAVNALLLNWAWDQYCQCASGSPTPLVYPTQQTAVTVPSTSQGAPCLRTEWQGTVPLTASPFDLSQFLGLTSLHPTGQIARVVTDSSGSYTVHGIPAGVTGILATSQYAPAPLCTGQYLNGAGVMFYDSTGATIGSNEPLSPSFIQPGTRFLTFPAGAVYWYFNGSQESTTCGPANQPMQVVLDFYCGSTPGVAGPCVTDPLVLQMLNTILSTLNAVYGALPGRLNSYAEGAVHSGLTGNGTITLSGNAIAVKVSITTDLPGGRIDLGSPNYLFDRGYIVAVTNEAPIRGITRLVYNPQLYVLPQLTEQIGYSLPAGEVISITELTAGP